MEPERESLGIIQCESLNVSSFLSTSSMKPIHEI